MLRFFGGKENLKIKAKLKKNISFAKRRGLRSQLLSLPTRKALT